jgi:hypothetical protein
MHLSDVVLDIYDDPTAMVLRAKLAGQELPPVLSDSTLLDPADLAVLPDRLFALVATNGDGVVRKYAMHDGAHVTTSIVYFLEKGHLLPETMQKSAARNLIAACQWYDLQPPDELVKRASVIDAAFGALDVKSRMEGAHAQSKANMDGFRAAQAGMSSDMQKRADLNGTEMMPMSGSISTLPAPRSTAKGSSSSSSSKQGAWEHAGDLTSHRPVDKTAQPVSKYAMPSTHRYPIDSYGDVKTAAAYFDENWEKFELDDRREFAVHVSNRLEELGLPVDGFIAKYAGHEYGPNIDVELMARVHNFEGTGHEAVYQVMLEKRASTPAHVMVEMLYEADLATGASAKYDASLGFRDPFQAVFGKVAENKTMWSWSEGNEYVNDTMLTDLAVNRYQSLDRAFGMDVRKSFQKDPIGTFVSMPDPQKIVIARLAADDSKS